MITVLDTHGPPREMGLEALEEEGEDSEKEAEEDGDENMMDGTGKHFFTNGCKNKPRICAAPDGPSAQLQVSHPSWLTLGCHLNRWCVVTAPLQHRSVKLKTLTQYNRNQSLRMKPLGCLQPVA